MLEITSRRLREAAAISDRIRALKDVLDDGSSLRLTASAGGVSIRVSNEYAVADLKDQLLEMEEILAGLGIRLVPEDESDRFSLISSGGCFPFTLGQA